MTSQTKYVSQSRIVDLRGISRINKLFIHRKANWRYSTWFFSKWAFRGSVKKKKESRKLKSIRQNCDDGWMKSSSVTVQMKAIEQYTCTLPWHCWIFDTFFTRPKWLNFTEWNGYNFNCCNFKRANVLTINSLNQFFECVDFHLNSRLCKCVIIL